MALVLGLNAKAYFGTAGATPATELSNIKNVTLNVEKNEIDVTTRAASGWRQKKGGLKDGSIEFEMMWDTADAGFTALQTAFFGDSQISFSALDGAGGQGLVLKNAEVMKFSRNEELENALTVNVTIAPGYGSAPEWVDGAGS